MQAQCSLAAVETRQSGSGRKMPGPMPGNALQSWKKRITGPSEAAAGLQMGDA